MAGGNTPYYDDGCVQIWHADCLETDVWLNAHALVTDPPYGMAFKSSRKGAFGDSEIEGDADTAARDAVLELWRDMPALVMGRWSVPRPAQTKMVLTWVKGDHVGMGDLSLPWKPNTEEIYVLGNGFRGHRGTSALYHLAIAGTVGNEKQGNRFHPTEKPVGLMVDLIQKCPPGVVADPFMGSGTTLVAAKALGVRAIGVEINESYCEIAAKRCAQGSLFEVGA